jgi:hypothetical protein
MTKQHDSNPHSILAERDIHNKVNISNGHSLAEKIVKHQFIPPQHIAHHPQPNVTIWREELNAKNNVQEQIKKQVFLTFWYTLGSLFMLIPLLD